MRKHYGFSKIKARKNPYVKLLKQPVTLRRKRSRVGWGLVHFSAEKRILRANGWPKTWTCPLPAA